MGTERARNKRRNARRRERYRLDRLLELERSLWSNGLSLIAGVDEVGRGPLAGPVVAAAVILPSDCGGIDSVRDSKQLSAQARATLAVEIRERALCWGVGAASVREIEHRNILRASHLAMRRALARLRPEPEHIVIDGLPVPELGQRQTAVVDGDAKVHCVACASILAKVVRDGLMERLAVRHPGYGWERNAGYATSEHREAILRLGPSPHHRLSFTSLQYALEFGDPDEAEPPIAVPIDPGATP
ncbi:MAG: ribonuclease HII [Longimicrobiales bacterium]